jgi:hypothetical protein
MGRKHPALVTGFLYSPEKVASPAVLDDGLTARWQRQLSPFPYSTKTYSGAFSSGEERSTLIDPSSAVHRDNSGFDSPSPLADSPAPPAGG